MRILGVSGPVRRNSYNTALPWAAARLLPPGAELVGFDGLKAIPAFYEDDEAQPGVAAAGLELELVRDSACCQGAGPERVEYGAHGISLLARKPFPPSDNRR